MSCRLASRTRTAIAQIGAGVLALSGCAVSDGTPYGLAELELGVQLEIPEDREADGGRIKTSAGYQYELETLYVDLVALNLRVRQAGATRSFDPANPPAGYSLCHNGHCHHDDGRLVAYEDIEAELGGETTSRTVLTQLVQSSPRIVTTTIAPARLGECPDRCALPRGEIEGLELEIARLTLVARVFDEPERDPPRLPELGLLVQLDSYSPFSIDEPLALAVDAGEPLVSRMNAVLQPSVRLFDGIDFEALVVEGSTRAVDLGELPEVQDLLFSNFEENTELRVEVVRTDAPREEE